MPFPFSLPTTSHLNYTDHLSSSTHPSLPLSATSARAVVRDALKKHKRLPPTQQPGHLNTVVVALNSYIPYLLALDAGTNGRSVAEEQLGVAVVKEIEVEWRCTLSTTIPGREKERRKIKGLENEITFVLQTLGYTQTLLARAQLRPLYLTDAALPSPEQRTQAVAAAMQHLLQAHAVHSFVLQRQSSSTYVVAPTSTPPDLTPGVVSALAAMALADATLITVVKDDPYHSALAEARNKQSKDWMFKAPDIPKVRAHLFARLCLAAAEHAAHGSAGVKNVKGVDEDLGRYLDDLRGTARAKAARFLGIDAEGQGKVGEGIAWLRGGLAEVGVKTGEDAGGLSGLAKLKRDFKGKIEDKRVGKGSSEWGGDAGKFEEGRVLEMLEQKWTKNNDTINMQIVPPSEALLASMPSGREYHSPKPYHPPSLDAAVLSRMRAPPDPVEQQRNRTAAADAANNSSDEEEVSEPPGAFPGGESSYY